MIREPLTSVVVPMSHNETGKSRQVNEIIERDSDILPINVRGKGLSFAKKGKRSGVRTRLGGRASECLGKCHRKSLQ